MTDDTKIFSYDSGSVITCNTSVAWPSINRDVCVPCPRGMNMSNGVCTCTSTYKQLNDVCANDPYNSATYADLVVTLDLTLGQRRL
jgi:hypothetical protein